jgi:excisionase family DNA binding protein
MRPCANGVGCVCAPALGGPARLSLSNTDRFCYACRERRIDGQLPSDAEPGEARTYTLTEAADVLGVPRGRVVYLVRAGQLRATKRQHGASSARLHIAEGDLRALEGAS